MRCFCIRRIVRNIFVAKYFIDWGLKKKSLPSLTSCIGITALVMCGYWLIYSHETMIDVLKKNALNPEFTAKNRISIPGKISGAHNVIEKVVFNFPLTESCGSEFCSVCLKPEMFTSKSYQNWICHNFGFLSDCNVVEVLHDWPQMKQLLGQAGRLNPYVIRGMSPPFYCASSRLADRLIRRTLGAREGKGSILMSDYSYQEKAELAFTCKMSPGTVMQKMFPFYEGWLINYSLGTCGLMTVHKHSMVTTLYQLYNAPWEKRLDVAIQLLDMARHFSENDSKFLLLIHRLTPHDLGISRTGKLIIQNSENIIVVDTADPQQGFEPKFRETAYHRERFHVAEERICRYNRTDVNYYTVCRNFLTGSWKGLKGETLFGGLLHDPEELSDFESHMFVLLDLCSRGSLAVPRDQVLPKVAIREVAAGHLKWLLAKKQLCDPSYPYRYPECEFFTMSERKFQSPNLEVKWFH